MFASLTCNEFLDLERSIWFSLIFSYKIILIERTTTINKGWGLRIVFCFGLVGCWFLFSFVVCKPRFWKFQIVLHQCSILRASYSYFLCNLYYWNIMHICFHIIIFCSYCSIYWILFGIINYVFCFPDNQSILYVTEEN